MLTGSSPATLVFGRSRIHKGFLHAIVERGGEVVFGELPFKIIVEPVGDDFVKVSLAAVGRKRLVRHRCYTPKKKETKPAVPATVVEGEIEI